MLMVNIPPSLLFTNTKLYLDNTSRSLVENAVIAEVHHVDNWSILLLALECIEGFEEW